MPLMAVFPALGCHIGSPKSASSGKTAAISLDASYGLLRFPNFS